MQIFIDEGQFTRITFFSAKSIRDVVRGKWFTAVFGFWDETKIIQTNRVSWLLRFIQRIQKFFVVNTRSFSSKSLIRYNEFSVFIAHVWADKLVSNQMSKSLERTQKLTAIFIKNELFCSLNSLLNSLNLKFWNRLRERSEMNLRKRPSCTWPPPLREFIIYEHSI